MNKFFTIIKYESKDLARKILPAFIVTVLLSIIAIVYIKSSVNIINQGFNDPSISNTTKLAISSILLCFVFIADITCFVITAFAIEKRFKKSMLTHEASFTHTVPVSESMQVWARFTSGVLWSFLCAVVIGVTFFSVFTSYFEIHELKESFIQLFTDEDDIKLFIQLVLSVILWSLTICAWYTSSVSAEYGLRLYIPNKVISDLCFAFGGLIVFYCLFKLSDWILDICNISIHITQLEQFFGLDAVILFCVINLCMTAINMVISLLGFNKKLNIV